MQGAIKLTLYLFSYIILLYGCKESPQKQIPQKKLTKGVKHTQSMVTAKPSDSITSKNAIDFLIRYGEAHPETRVHFKTRLGNLSIKLYKDTPLHRASFLFLINNGYFNTTCFHRIVPNFIVQGGNSENPNTLRIKNKYQNYTIPPEFRTHRKHKYGALAAAREWENNPSKKSNPFEFYFIQAKKGAHHINGEHTVFGEITSGFDTLEKISRLQAGRDEWPYKDVFIKAKVLN